MALRSADAPAALSAPVDAPGGSTVALPPLEPAEGVPAASGDGLAHDGAAAPVGSGSGAAAAAVPAASGDGVAHEGVSPAGGNGAVMAAAAPAGKAAAELARRCKRKKKDREKGKVLQGAAG